MSKRSESAAANIAAGKMNCSQSVLTAFSGELGLDLALARKVALGFGGGMGRTGRTCGAVTGAYMVLGLQQDLNAGNVQQIKDNTYARVREFTQKFSAANGSTLCKDILGCDLSTPAGAAFAKEHDLFTVLCPKFVKSAVEILDQMSAGSSK